MFQIYNKVLLLGVLFELWLNWYDPITETILHKYFIFITKGRALIIHSEHTNIGLEINLQNKRHFVIVLFLVMVAAESKFFGDFPTWRGACIAC